MTTIKYLDLKMPCAEYLLELLTILAEKDGLCCCYVSKDMEVVDRKRIQHMISHKYVKTGVELRAFEQLCRDALHQHADLIPQAEL